MKVTHILERKGRDVITISQRETIRAASQLLLDHNIGVLLAVDAGGNPIGILSERDIVRRFAAEGGAIEDLTVADVMTDDLIVADPDDEIQYVMQVMTQERIRHLPILKGGKLVGLVSIGDVVRSHINEVETEIRHLRSYITGQQS